MRFLCLSSCSTKVILSSSACLPCCCQRQRNHTPDAASLAPCGSDPPPHSPESRCPQSTGALASSHGGASIRYARLGCRGLWDQLPLSPLNHVEIGNRHLSSMAAIIAPSRTAPTTMPAKTATAQSNNNKFHISVWSAQALRYCLQRLGGRLAQGRRLHSLQIRARSH